MKLSRFSRFAALAASLIVGFALTSTHAQEQAGESIQDKMTPEQFKAAGLDKLSSKELENLNKWLYGYRETAVKTAAKRAERQAAEVTVSRVDGVFNGIGGNTIVHLEDGTAWKQANSEDHWRAPGLDHPAAAVVKTMFGHRMQIVGSPPFYVDPVRQ